MGTFQGQRDNWRSADCESALAKLRNGDKTVWAWPSGRDSSVGIAILYGLDGTGIESRWGRDFPHPSRPALGPTQLPIQWVQDYLGLKRPGRGVHHPPPSRAEGEGRVELYICYTRLE
jgi:hypothetical protein